MSTTNDVKKIITEQNNIILSQQEQLIRIEKIIKIHEKQFKEMAENFVFIIENQGKVKTDKPGEFLNYCKQWLLLCNEQMEENNDKERV